MKSSAVKLLLIISAVVFPLIIWSIINQPQDLRGRAVDDTLTPTATPSATLTPSVTPSITPTPTNSPPICLGLSANPGAGSKPLTVNFACAGYDGNNDITAAEFGFGGSEKQLVEKNVGQYGSLTVTHTYAAPGTYNATCRVRDNNNAFSNYPSYCTYTVIVSDNALTPTPIRTPAPTRAIGIERLSDGPVILNGALPTLQPSPTPTMTVLTPTPPPPKESWWSNDKIMQLVSMVLISGITIFVALTLHAFFDRR